MCKTSILKIFFPCLYNFTLPKYREDPDTDPVKIFPIRPKRSGSIRIRIRNPDLLQYASPGGEDTCLDPASFGPPPVRNYFAFSTFWYLVSGLGLPSSHSLRTLSTKVEQLCNLPRYPIP